VAHVVEAETKEMTLLSSSSSIWLVSLLVQAALNCKLETE